MVELFLALTNILANFTFVREVKSDGPIHLCKFQESKVLTNGFGRIADFEEAHNGVKRNPGARSI